MTEYKKKRAKVKMRQITEKVKTFISEKPPILTPVQEQALLLARKSILNPDYSLRVAPISDTCYVEGENLYIKFGISYIVIRTLTSTFFIDLPYPASSKLISFFNLHAEKRRQEREREYDLLTVEHLKKALLLV